MGLFEPSIFVPLARSKWFSKNEFQRSAPLPSSLEAHQMEPRRRTSTRKRALRLSIKTRWMCLFRTGQSMRFGARCKKVRVLSEGGSKVNPRRRGGTFHVSWERAIQGQMSRVKSSGRLETLDAAGRLGWRLRVRGSELEKSVGPCHGSLLRPHLRTHSGKGLPGCGFPSAQG